MTLGLKTATRFHVWLYRATKGRAGNRVRSAPILLLATTGRKSGKTHTTPLGFVRVDDQIVVCGANLGSDLPPAWLRNLQHDPRVWITIGSLTYQARARVADADERNDAWTKLTEQLPALRRYQAKTTRVFPVVFLEPLGSRFRGSPSHE